MGNLKSKMFIKHIKKLAIEQNKKNMWFPARPVFFSTVNRPSGTSVDDLREQETIEGSKEMQRRIEGFYLSQPIALPIERERLIARLGVDRATAATLQRRRQRSGVALPDIILEKRINEELARVVHEQEEIEQESRPWWAKLGHNIESFAKKYVLHPVAFASYTYNRNQRSPFEDLRLSYGESRNVGHMRQHAANQLREAFLRDLTLTDQADITAVATRLGHPTPATATIDEICSVLMLAGQPVPPGQPRQATLEEVNSLRDFETAAGGRPFLENHDFERLRTLLQTEVQERGKMLNVQMYDPGRLGRFLETMRTAPPIPPATTNVVYKLLTEQVLEKDAININNLKNDPEAQALLSHLCFIYESNGGTDLTPVQRALEKIKNQLPEAKIKPSEAAEAKDVEKIDPLLSKAEEQKEKIVAAYDQAAGYNIEMNDLKQQEHSAQLASTSAAGKAASNTANINLQNVQQQMRDLGHTRQTIFSAVNNEEITYRNSVKALVAILLRIQNPKSPPTVPSTPELTRLYNGAQHTNSKPQQLFVSFNPPAAPGAAPVAVNPTAGALQTHIVTDLTPGFFNTLSAEIKTQYKTLHGDRERIGSRHTLVLLIEDYLAENNIGNPSNRRNMAVLKANEAVADAGTLDIYRHGNREAAKRMIGGIQGAWEGTGRWFASKIASSTTFKAQDIIDVLATRPGCEKFAGLKSNFSQAEARRYLDSKGVEKKELAVFYAHLTRAMQEYKVADLENITLILRNLHVYIETREFMKSLEDPSEEDKKLSQHAYFTKLMAQKSESEKELLKSIQEIKTGKQWKDIREDIKEKKAAEQAQKKEEKDRKKAEKEAKKDKKEEAAESKTEGEKPKEGGGTSEKQEKKWPLRRKLKWAFGVSTFPLWGPAFGLYKLWQANVFTPEKRAKLDAKYGKNKAERKAKRAAAAAERKAKRSHGKSGSGH